MEGLHGDIEVPLERVRDVQILDEPIKEIHGLQPSGMKLAGTYIPGKIAVGAFLSGFEPAADLRRGPPRLPPAVSASNSRATT